MSLISKTVSPNSKKHSFEFGRAKNTVHFDRTTKKETAHVKPNSAVGRKSSETEVSFEPLVNGRGHFWATSTPKGCVCVCVKQFIGNDFNKVGIYMTLGRNLTYIKYNV